MKPHTVISTTVSCPIEQAWPTLWRKATHTKQFIPNLTFCDITEISSDVVDRTMKMGDLTIKEYIIKDNHSKTVYFHNVEGSNVRGCIHNRLWVDQNGKVILQFGSEAVNGHGDLIPNVEGFKKTMQHTKQIMQQTYNKSKQQIKTDKE